MRKAGFEPIALCVGTCVYHVGIQYGNWNKNQEMDVLSKAMYHARELAMERMRAEATAMGADGIVGVKLDDQAARMGSASCSNSSRSARASSTAPVTPGSRAHDGGPVHLRSLGSGFLVALTRRLPPPSRW